MVRRLLAVAGVVAMVASISLAQAAQRQQGQDGRGVLGRDGFQGNGAMLLRLQGVQNELHLSNEQKDQVDDMFAGLATQGRSIFSPRNLQALQNPSDEDRKTRLEEFRKQMEGFGKKIDERLASILEPEQRERLSQIRLQSEGVQAFSRADVAEKLDLSQEQREQIAKIQQDLLQFRPDQTGLRNPQEISKEEWREFLAKMREEGERFRQKVEQAKDDALAVLNPAQKEQWEKMQGKKFAFQQF